MSQSYNLEEINAKASAAQTDPSEKRHECQHHENCMKMIQLVLDGEANPEQFEHIRQNIGKCLPCQNGYNLERSIKQALTLRLEKQEVPPTLLESIRSRITSL